MDKLKEYINQHRDEMDVDGPPEHLLQNIQSNAQRTSSTIKIYRITRYAAAAVILMIAVGLWMRTKKENEKKQTGIVEKRQPATNNPGIVAVEKKDTIINQSLQATVMQQPKKLPVYKRNDLVSAITTIDDIEAADKSYSHLINYQIEKLNSTPVYAEEPAYFNDFETQLKQMYKDEQVIKNDIKIYGANDQLLEQLINIYQQKLNLLKMLQAEINKMNKKIRQTQVTGAQQAYYLNI